MHHILSPFVTISLRRFSVLLSGLLLSQPAHAKDGVANIELSYERLYLPGVNFGGIYDFTDPQSPIVRPLQQSDGTLDGVRADVGLGFSTVMFGGPETRIGVRGFYAAHRDSSDNTCFSVSAALACDGAGLYDPSVVANNSAGFGAGETVSYAVERDVKHWGESIDVRLAKFSSPGGTWETRGGIGHRALYQDFSLAADFSITSSHQDYRESLDTNYFGGFAGISGTQTLAPGLQLVVDAEGGVYSAQTSFDGQFSVRNPYGGSNREQLSLDRDEAAFAGSLKVGLEHDAGILKIGAFVRGEYYSYVPSMSYNQTDRAAGFPSPYSIKGQDGTRIESDNAWALSVGTWVTVPFGNPP
jgi:hypothetical protein